MADKSDTTSAPSHYSYMPDSTATGVTPETRAQLDQFENALKERQANLTQAEENSFRNLAAGKSSAREFESSMNSFIFARNEPSTGLAKQESELKTAQEIATRTVQTVRSEAEKMGVNPAPLVNQEFSNGPVMASVETEKKGQTVNLPSNVVQALNDPELAFIAGHEVAHIKNHDKLTTGAESKAQELKADADSLRANKDFQAAASALRKLLAPEATSTHPSTEARIQALQHIAETELQQPAALPASSPDSSKLLR